MALAVGMRLGAYEITGTLGAGGMGEVYRATDTKLGRDVAIKTLPGALAQDPERLARFEREAKLLAALNHAHIAAIYGLDEHDGTQFLAMELVEGETLEERLKAGPLVVEDALPLALQIAEALEAAHERGVVHRDLKPANIMITHDGVVKVLDFGLAKAFSGDANEASPAHSPALSVAMTQQGLILGTAAYMSPEQASGQGTDQRADVWAFGVVLYEMLTGVPLFGGESVPHVLAAVLQTDPDWNRLPKGLHPRLKLLLERCLTKKPRNRLHSMADARIEIEDVLNDPQGARASASAEARTSGRRALPLVAAAVIVTLAVATLVGWSLWPQTGPAVPVVRFAYSVSQTQTVDSVGRSLVALSPDGRKFVYGTPEGLYLRSMDQLDGRPIAGTDENPANPFFSPDGQSVAYFAGGQLKRVALSGGAPVIIAGDVKNLFGASWASGGTILFGQPQGIFRVRADGGTPELVIAAEQGERLYGPELLPDGDSVLFSATTARWDDAQVVVQKLSGGERTELVDGGSDAHYVPTGHLVYALRDGLFAVAFDPATLTVSGGAVSVVQSVARAPADTTAAANYGISADGTLIYVSGNGRLVANVDRVWVDRDRNEEPLGLDTLSANPALSPDGTRLAFDYPTPDLTDADIWIWSLAQHTRTRLTFEPGFQFGASWSPDSTRIAYDSLAEGLFVRPADGTGMPEQLLQGANIVPGDWLGDDQLIFSEQTDSAGWDIGVVSLAGDHERRSLLATKFNERGPALSPDGRWLAYDSDESGQFEIYVRPFPDVGAGKWLVSSGGGQEPKWSRDGRTLVFLGPESVMETAVGTGSPFTHEAVEAVLDREPYTFGGTPREYDISPDAQRFLLAKQSSNGANTAADLFTQIVVVTNWTEELKQRVPAQ
jgi:Tol biopolymer transport system component/predicted Ser/Thr protein kinase